MRNLPLKLLALGTYIGVLLLFSDSLSLSFFEVDIINGDQKSILNFPMHLLTHYFGNDAFLIRLFMITMHIATLFLFFRLSEHYLKKERDKLWNLIIFVMLPGVLSSAIIVHDTGVVLFLLLFFVYSFNQFKEKSFLLLPFYLFINPSFFILFAGISLYEFFQKRWYLSGISFLLFLLSFYFFGFETNYMPKNYLFENFGVLGIVFSPLVFLYMIYTLFRIAVRGEKDLVWSMAWVALILLVILSFRQKVPLEQFAPYFIILLPRMVAQFMHSYRMRIRPLRRAYQLFFAIAILFLLLNTLAIYLNKYFFLVVDKAEHHFLIDHYIAKELAEALKAQHIYSVKISDGVLQKRLKFYGIKDQNRSMHLEKNSCKNVTISYIGRDVAYYCVTKNNSPRKSR